VLSGLAGSWEEIRIQEIINYATYDQPQVLFETMGFAQPMDAPPLLLTPGTLAFAWGGTVRLLADGLGLQLDEIRQEFERRPATRAVTIGKRTVEPGTMGALRFEVQGIVGGVPAIVVEHVTRIDDTLAPEPPHGHRLHRRLAQGDPRTHRRRQRAREGRPRLARRQQIRGRARPPPRRGVRADGAAHGERDPRRM